MSVTSSAAESIAEKLRQAESSGKPIPPIRDDLAKATVDEAYRVQQINRDFFLAEGRTISGRKIGLTSRAVQQQLGVDQPDFGVLWADTEYQDGQDIPWQRLQQPRVECEVALVLGRAIDNPRPGLADVLRAVEYVVPALEVVGSRIADWKISIFDTIADNASCGVYVLGGPPRRLPGLDLRTCGMVMERDGQPVSTGCGAACLGHPLHAAVWLAQTMVTRNMPLQAGEIVLTGALGPMVNVNPGDVFHARIQGLGSVRASFAEG
jgi:2-keto-4-pentenoate hydratase